MPTQRLTCFAVTQAGKHAHERCCTLARRTRQTQPYAMHATSPRVNAIHARAQPTGLGRAQGPDRGDAGRRRLAPSARGQGVARLSLAPRIPWARGARLGKHDSARTCEHRQDRPRVAARRAPSAPSHHRRQCINNIYAATRCRGGCKHYLAAW